MDLSKYAIGATGVGTSALGLKKMACLKIRVDNVDLDKLKTISADLSKLNDVVDVKDNMLSKELCIVNWLPKLMLLIVIPSFSGLAKNLDRRYPTLVGWSRRLITTQKLRRLKTSYLLLLIYLLPLLSIQKPQSSKINYLTLLNSLPNLL